MENFKKDLKEIYNNKCNLYIDDNNSIIRGHISDISDDFENLFAKYLSGKLGKNYNIYVDFTMDNGRRPDIIIIKKENDKEYIKGIIELKANLGYIRDDDEKLIETIKDNIKYINDNKELKIYYTRQERYLYNNNITQDLNDKDIELIKKHLNNNKEKSIKAQKIIYRKEKIDYLLVALTSYNISKEKRNNYKNKFKKRLLFLFDGWYYDLKDRKEDIDNLNKYISKIKLT